MDQLTNVVWLLTITALLIGWRRLAPASSTHWAERQRIGAIVLIIMIGVLLFPVISDSDDIHWAVQLIGNFESSGVLPVVRPGGRSDFHVFAGLALDVLPFGLGLYLLLLFATSHLVRNTRRESPLGGYAYTSIGRAPPVSA